MYSALGLIRLITLILSPIPITMYDANMNEARLINYILIVTCTEFITRSRQQIFVVESAVYLRLSAPQL